MPRCTKRTGRGLGLSGSQSLERVQYVSDCADFFESLRRNFLARYFLQLNQQIDGIDAVNFQILIQIRIQCDRGFLDVKLLDKDVTNLCKKAVLVHSRIVDGLSGKLHVRQLTSNEIQQCAIQLVPKAPFVHRSRYEVS